LLAAPFVRVPPTLGVTLIWSATVSVLACTGVLLLALRLDAPSTTRVGLVGAMLGPLGVVATAPLVLPRIDGFWVALGAAVGSVSLLAFASLGGAALASRLAAGRNPSAALTWAGASLMLAGIAWTLGRGPVGSPWIAPATIPAGFVLATAGLRGHSAWRVAAPRAHFGGLLAMLALAASALPFWPWLLPWILAEQELPPVAPWPPNLVVVAVNAAAGADAAALEAGVPVLGMLRADALSYASVSPEPEVRSLLSLPGGETLGARLHQSGFATAAMAIVPGTLEGLGVDELDDRPGGRRFLRESAAWMAGTPLLLGPASGLLGVLAHDGPHRSAEQVGDEAARWILRWRISRAPTPFFLVVDLRTRTPELRSLERGLDAVLDRLEGLRLAPLTILVVAVETRVSAASPPSLRALVVLPPTWSGPRRGEIEPPVWGRALSRSLLEIALGDGGRPVRLVGLRDELSPPDRP
jgi:hypothetical protein